jgi:hypothetical protein
MLFTDTRPRSALAGSEPAKVWGPGSTVSPHGARGPALAQLCGTGISNKPSPI